MLHGWIVCENKKLAFQRQNQSTLRADTYQSIRDSVANRRQNPRHQDSLYHIESDKAVGRVILSSSFVGGP